MPEIPSIGGEELITKGFVLAELAAFERSLTRRVLAILVVHTIVVTAEFAFT